MKHIVYNPYFDGHKKQNEQDEPATFGWQYDEHGRKYRQVGDSREYAMTVHTSGGDVYIDELEEHNKRVKEAQEKRRIEEEAAAKAAQTNRECPFKIGQNSIITRCEKSCAFYIDTGCVLASTDRPATKDTKNMDCIIARKCNERCAMYNHGCTLIDIVKGMKPGKE